MRVFYVEYYRRPKPLSLLAVPRRTILLWERMAHKKSRLESSIFFFFFESCYYGIVEYRR